MQLCDKERTWFHVSQSNKPGVVLADKLDDGNLAENEELGVFLVVGSAGIGRGGGKYRPGQVMFLKDADSIYI